MQRWDIVKTTYRVSDFISWQRSGTLVLSPSFQRRPVWSATGKSLLVDSVIRGLPVPLLFLRDVPSDLESLEPKREVVDGQQRIRTLISFIAPSLLSDYDESRDPFVIRKTHNPEYGGMSFRELPREIQRSILDYQFSVHIFPENTDDRDVLQIFARMNSTGVKLNPQEIRHAEFIGEFKRVMYQLAAEQLFHWRSWGLFSDNDIARMDEVSLTNELVILMLQGVATLNAASVTKYYKLYDDDFPQAEEASRRFQHIMDLLDQHLGNELTSALAGRRPLFSACFTAVYNYAYGLKSTLDPTQGKVPPPAFFRRILQRLAEIRQGGAPEEVMIAAAHRTTNPGVRRQLFEYLSK